MWLTRLGSESAAERRQSYPRKHAASENSEILGSEGSKKIGISNVCGFSKFCSSKDFFIHEQISFAFSCSNSYA
jgi:hypothetical protein